MNPLKLKITDGSAPVETGAGKKKWAPGGEVMCGIGTGKSQSPGKPSSCAQTLPGIPDPNNTAPPAIAARPKKLLRDNAARNLEAVEVLCIGSSPFYWILRSFLLSCLGESR